MIKMMIGLFTGMLLVGLIFIGPLSQIMTKANTGSSGLAEGQADNMESSTVVAELLANYTESYLRGIILLLDTVGSEIQDSDTGEFYQKLLREYDLDQESLMAAQTENASLTEVMPDVKNISVKALSLPLLEAGKNIRDKDLAQFYYALLQGAGWKIEAD